MKTKSKPNTRLAGASDERDAVLAYVRRQKDDLVDRGYLGIADELAKIEKWLLGRAKRYNKAKGGLGK